MSNEYYDIAAMDPLRTGGAGERSFRVGLLTQVLLACVAGRPALEVMGLRLWVLCERLCPGVLPGTNAAMRKRLAGVLREAWEVLQVSAGDTEADDVRRVVEILLGMETVPWKMGRRVTLLAYFFVREDMRQVALPSFEVIGQLWMLRAKNPRSAVCAAMDKLLGELVKRGFLRQAHEEMLPNWWFQKKQGTKKKYAIAQVGNRNRADSRCAVDGGLSAVDETDDAPGCVREALRREHAELVQGVPVRAAFQHLTPLQLRRRLNELHEAAEMRRLGVGGE